MLDIAYVLRDTNGKIYTMGQYVCIKKEKQVYIGRLEFIGAKTLILRCTDGLCKHMTIKNIQEIGEYK